MIYCREKIQDSNIIYLFVAGFGPYFDKKRIGMLAGVAGDKRNY
jgi:hypothetical protein